MIAAKRIYDPPSSSEGTRVLIMRLWPRGIKKSRVDVWLKELGPVLPLLRAFRSGEVDWAGYTPRYLEGLERPEAQEQLAQVRDASKNGTVTLFCGCSDEARCHRSLLRAYLLDSPASRRSKPGPTPRRRAPMGGAR